MAFSFSYITPHWSGYYQKKIWYFGCAMISTCSPAFDHLEDNYEVYEELSTAGVIHHRNTCMEAESCELYGDFFSQKAANNFIDRLNDYLKYLEEKCA